MSDFVPEVEIHLAEEGLDGAWHYKFTLKDPAQNDHQYPVDYAGAALDFDDPEVLKELWKKYGFKHDQDFDK